jgi:hypothetical protein
MICTLHYIRVIKSRRMRWAVHMVRQGRGVYKVLVGKPEGNRLLGRPSQWEDNIRMGVQRIGWEGVN